MRLDNYLTEKGYFDSRTKAKQSIERGEIFINSKLINKASYEINEDLEYKIERICEDSFVSLGGFKLKKAITDFNFDCNNLIVADIGASTGGFTDCLLKNGAKKVYAIDLNDELLHKSLKEDNRVVSIIKNAKDLTLKDFDDKIDLIVADLSFISLTMVIGKPIHRIIQWFVINIRFVQLRHRNVVKVKNIKFIDFFSGLEILKFFYMFHIPNSLSIYLSVIIESIAIALIISSILSANSELTLIFIFSSSICSV